MEKELKLVQKIDLVLKKLDSIELILNARKDGNLKKIKRPLLIDSKEDKAVKKHLSTKQTDKTHKAFSLFNTTEIKELLEEKEKEVFSVNKIGRSLTANGFKKCVYRYHGSPKNGYQIFINK